MALSTDLRRAVDAVRRACHMSRMLQQRYCAPERAAGSCVSISKADESPVTVADFAVQALVLHSLGHGNGGADDSEEFVAEETAEQLRSDSALLAEVQQHVNSYIHDKFGQLTGADICEAIDRGGSAGGDQKRTWVLDPVDGTKGFLRVQQFCIALGLLEAGKVVLGVLGCPNLDFQEGRRGCVFYACRGEGAFVVSDADTELSHAERVHVSGLRDLPACRFMESFDSGHSSFETSAKVAVTLGTQEPPVRMDSQCKYASLARGDAQIYLRFPKKGYRENIWDHAGGVIVIEEAGGRVTDGTGAPLNFGEGRKLHNRDGIVATNGLVHDAVIRAVQEAVAQ